MTKITSKFIKLSAVTSLMAFLLVPNAVQAQYSGVNGRIVSYAINYGAVSVKPDGSNYYGQNIPFVNSGWSYRQYAYSPDGSKIAYSVAEGSNNVSLYVKSSTNYAATGTRLTTATGGSQDMEPYFSPDGTKVAFVRKDGTTTDNDVFVVNVDGTGLTRLTQAMYTTSSVECPVWKADGSVIYVKTSDAGANGTGIYSISPTTANQNTATNIVTNAQMTGFNYPFDISPDGSTFVYQSLSGNNGSLSSIRKVGSSGSGDTAVATSDTNVRWTFGSISPDGTKIVATKSDISASPYSTRMITMNIDGTGQSAIFTAAAGQPFEYSDDFSPFWGTSQNTFSDHGTFSNFQNTNTPAAPNTSAISKFKKNLAPIALASAAATLFVGLLAYFGKTELDRRKKRR